MKKHCCLIIFIFFVAHTFANTTEFYIGKPFSIHYIENEKKSEGELKIKYFYSADMKATCLLEVKQKQDTLTKTLFILGFNKRNKDALIKIIDKIEKWNAILKTNPQNQEVTKETDIINFEPPYVTFKHSDDLYIAKPLSITFSFFYTAKGESFLKIIPNPMISVKNPFIVGAFGEYLIPQESLAQIKNLISDKNFEKEFEIYKSKEKTVEALLN